MISTNILYAHSNVGGGGCFVFSDLTLAINIQPKVHAKVSHPVIDNKIQFINFTTIVCCNTFYVELISHIAFNFSYAGSFELR